MTKKMKLKFFLIAFIMNTISEAQVSAIDWANINRYEKANTELSKETTANKKPRVVLIGNSITEGWVNTMPDFFSKNNYIGRGIGGQTSAQILLRFRNDVIQLKPAVIVINIGINDIAQNAGTYNEDFTLGNIASMIEIAQANRIKVILASVLPAASIPWRPEVKHVANQVISLNQQLKKLSEKHKISYLDYHSKLKNSENGLSIQNAEDGVHPSLDCYKIMASMLQNEIDSGIW